jgi:hypothetical protein
MEEIRIRARQGLMAAPRVGMGVGGLLLGVREGVRIRLLDSVDIRCSHSAGPAFDLTPDEKRESLEIIAEAGAPGVPGKVGVVGWYCSKTRGDASLSRSDLSLYEELFPELWQVALVVRPSVVEAMRAAFFFRDENGLVVKGIECDVDEWRPAPESGLPSVEPKPETADSIPTRHQISVAAKSVQAISIAVPEAMSRPPRPKTVDISPPSPKAAETPRADITDLAEGIARAGPVANQTPVRPAALRMETFDVPGFAVPRPAARSKIRLALPIAATLLAAGVAAYFTQEYWMPKPPLTLNSTEINGTLLIRWNPGALRGIDHASMFVNDGGQPIPSLIPLDQFQLNSGLLSYTPKSQRVTAKLDAGETSAITAWFAEMPAPAALVPKTPALAAQPSASNDGKAKK